MKFATLVRTCTCLSLAVFAAMASFARGDTLKLKDGTVLEGTATQIPPDSVKFIWRIKSIVDEKVFKKSEIAELIIVSPDEAAVIPLRKLIPTRDNMSAAEISKIIESQLKPWLAKFPSSKFGKEVQGILDTYKSDLEKINLGGIKLDGQWIEPSEFKAKEYIYNALILRKEMDEEVKKGNIKEALDFFTRLKKEHIVTPAFVAAIDTYDKLLNEQYTNLTTLQAEFPTAQAELEARKKTLAKAELDELELALRKNKDELKLKNSIEAQSQTPILTYDKLDLASLKSAQLSIQKELAKVAKLKELKPKYEEAAQWVEKALAESAKGNPILALTHYEQAKKSLPAPDPKLTAMIAATKAAADEMQKSLPKITPSTTGSSKGDPANPAKSGDKSPSKKPETTKADGDAAKPAKIKMEDEDDNTTMYLLMAAGALVLGGLGWMFASKRKKRGEE